MELDTSGSRNRFKRLRSLAACGFIAGALLMGTGSAANAAPSAEGAATPARETLARPCGYSEDEPEPIVYYAYWNNCGDSSEKINVDTLWWPDFEVCVRPHSTMNLGEAGSHVSGVRGATYLWSGCSPYDN